jgi:hypothetical protein
MGEIVAYSIVENFNRSGHVFFAIIIGGFCYWTEQKWLSPDLWETAVKTAPTKPTKSPYGD